MFPFDPTSNSFLLPQPIRQLVETTYIELSQYSYAILTSRQLSSSPASGASEYGKL